MNYNIGDKVQIVGNEAGGTGPGKHNYMIDAQCEIISTDSHFDGFFILSGPIAFYGDTCNQSVHPDDFTPASNSMQAKERAPVSDANDEDPNDLTIF